MKPSRCSNFCTSGKLSLPRSCDAACAIYAITSPVDTTSCPSKPDAWSRRRIKCRCSLQVISHHHSPCLLAYHYDSVYAACSALMELSGCICTTLAESRDATTTAENPQVQISDELHEPCCAYLRGLSGIQYCISEATVSVEYDRCVVHSTFGIPRRYEAFHVPIEPLLPSLICLLTRQKVIQKQYDPTNVRRFTQRGIRNVRRGMIRRLNAAF